jgi:hypothetical protein
MNTNDFTRFGDFKPTERVFPDLEDVMTECPTDFLGRPLVGNRNRPTTEPGGCECMRCGAIFVGAECHDLCRLCADEPARQTRTPPMPNITDHLADECVHIYRNKGSTPMQSMRAVLEHAFAHREPDAEVTDAAVEALAEELHGRAADGYPDAIGWAGMTEHAHDAWRRVARHVLTFRQPKAVDGQEFANARKIWWPNEIPVPFFEASDGSVRLSEWSLPPEIKDRLARIATLEGELGTAKAPVEEDVSDKPPMPAHDYAWQWARDTLSGKAGGGRFSWGERNIARAYLALNDATQPGTIRLGSGLTEAQEAMPSGSKLSDADRMFEASRAIRDRCHWFKTQEGSDVWRSISDRLSDMATALRASAAPKPDPRLSVVTKTLMFPGSNYGMRNAGEVAQAVLDDLDTALRAKGV